MAAEWARRTLMKASGAALAGNLLLGAPAISARPKAEIKAIAFDALAIFDPLSPSTLCQSMFSAKGAQLLNLWNTRRFEYAWLRTIMKSYANFEKVTEDALAFASTALGIELQDEQRQKLMSAQRQLKVWDDAPESLAGLKARGFKLGFLSNFTARMLHHCIDAGNLKNLFEQVTSTDAIRSYKPDSRAYEFGTDAFQLSRQEILFVAYASWDAAGAKTFGYPTFWLNRSGLPEEVFGVELDGQGSRLADLLRFLEVG